MIDVRVIQKQQRETKNLLLALATGKDKKGLTFRLVGLTENTRTRGGAKSKRRTVRVWEPITVSVEDVDDGTDAS
jgi:hypothetical protein